MNLFQTALLPKESTVCQMKGSGKCCMDQEERSFVTRQKKVSICCATSVEID